MQQVDNKKINGFPIANPLDDCGCRAPIGIRSHINIVGEAGESQKFTGPLAQAQSSGELPESITSLINPSPNQDFRVTSKGVLKRVKKGAGQSDQTENDWVYVCSPLEIIADTCDAQGQAWGRLLAVHTRDGQVHQWAMPMKMLAGNGTAYREELLDLGLEMAPGPFARNSLHEYISTARPTKRLRCVKQIGWHEATFVLPGRSYGEEQILFQATSVREHAFQIAGTLEEWQQNIAHYCEGNSRLAFVVSCAFAAPLLYLAKLESGGFHLRGSSSVGKTTALLAAGSVWGGGGINGYCRSWRATSNGLEAVGVAHCDTLLCLDEMGQVAARELSDTAYMLANGQGKSRSLKDGSGRPPAQWRVLFLSTGELSLVEKMHEVGRKAQAGQEVRLVDIPADAEHGLGLFEDLHGFDRAQAFADHLHRATGKFYGTAIRAYLEQIVKNQEQLGATVGQASQDFVEKSCSQNADGQVQRVAYRFGLVAAAGELAGTLGILPWPADEAKRAAATCFKAWLEQRGGTGPAELAAGVEQVRRFFQAHGTSRFGPWKNDNEDRTTSTSNRVGLYRQLDGIREYFVFPSIFRGEVTAGYDTTTLTKELIRLKLLLPGGTGKSVSTHNPPSIGKPIKLYHFSSAVLGGEGDDLA
ncbi:putative DNA primase/helicase [Desulfovibrionales bacterium]